MMSSLSKDKNSYLRDTCMLANITANSAHNISAWSSMQEVCLYSSRARVYRLDKDMSGSEVCCVEFILKFEHAEDPWLGKSSVN